MTRKKVLVTAGTVYGSLDDNKLVGNRVRGIWASRFARWLTFRGHEVTLLVADTQRRTIGEEMSEGPLPPYEELMARREHSEAPGSLDVLEHKGFWDYQDQCYKLARLHDAAVMAAAVVNWIPQTPYPGKMSTTSLRELNLFQPIKTFTHGDEPIPGKTIVDVPFILAPRVIDNMRKENPKLTLIGCKMTIDATRDEMIEAAYKTLLGAKCHAVIANDMQAIVDKTPDARPGDLSIHQLTGLRAKTVLYPDRARFDFDITDRKGVSFYRHLESIITDEHFETQGCGPCWSTEQYEYAQARVIFDRIVEKYRDRFVHKTSDRVFGSLAVRLPNGGALCSAREKRVDFSSKDAVEVAPLTLNDVRNRRITTVGSKKATMNAPLLLRHLDKIPSATAVLHLHEQLPSVVNGFGVMTVPYAPPGTARDNLREIVGPIYNIEGHGCVVALDDRGEMYGNWVM